jgi:basic membrane protein A
MREKRLLTNFGVVGLILTLVVLLLAGCAKPTPAPPPEAIKMAIATIGAKTDGSWSQSFYEAYLYIQKKYPNVDVTFSDLCPYAEFPSILETFGGMGIDLVYVDSAWFEAVSKVAPKHPNTWFVMPNLTEADLEVLSNNVTTYVSKDEQGGYLAGVAAGMITKTNKLGYVAGADYPDIKRAGNGFALGARSVNPDVTLSVVYTGDWVSVEKGYESAKALIALGVDVIMHYNDNAGLGVIKAAKEAGVYVVGEARDQADLAPANVITSYLVDHPRLAEKALLDLKAGTISKRVQEFGIEEGWPVMAPLRNVPEEVKVKVKETETAIKKGEIAVPVIFEDPKGKY